MKRIVIINVLTVTYFGDGRKATTC